MTTPSDIEEFRYSPLWESVDSVKAVLSEAKGRSVTDRHTLARAIATLSYLGGHRSLTPLIASYPNNYALLNALDQPVEGVRSQIEGWDQSAAMTATTVSQLDGFSDRILNLLHESAWPVLQRDSKAQAFLESADALRIASDASLRAVEEDLASTRESVQSANEALLLVRTEMEQMQGSSQAVVAKMTEDRAAQEATAAIMRNEEAKKIIAEGLRQREDFSRQAKEFLTVLENDAEKGRELVKLVGDQSVAGGYTKFADQELRAYRWWNGFGALASALAIVYLLLEFQHLETLTLQASIVRVALAVPALGFAAYAFQQAGTRHRQSVEAKYRALDLLALEPFTKDMTPEQQEQLRVVLGQRLFSSRADETNDSDVPNTVVTVDQLQIVTSLLQSMKEIIK